MECHQEMACLTDHELSFGNQDIVPVCHIHYIPAMKIAAL
jgi:hypothetical protein